eukprot:TRINITY_DN60658_c0_g1_i1.p1 TRINITY_DN60658_c0_g1~~TRINITY_DN60658_c0_g1_i1.p1  ORF type:complete len:249 (+),score=15.42 TRINITY_DN60658_c0_g1_i1:71-817(+)
MPRPCAHVGFGFLLAEIFRYILPTFVASTHVVLLDFVIVITSLLPDIIDKPLFLCRWALGSRSYGHTVLFLFSATCVVSAVLSAFGVGPVPVVFPSFHPSQRADDTAYLTVHGWGVVVFVGILSHLLSDLAFGYVPLFWPLQPFREAGAPSLGGWALSSRAKLVADVAGCIYVAFGTAVPQHVGGVRPFVVLALVAAAMFHTATQLVGHTIRRRRRAGRSPAAVAERSDFADASSAERGSSRDTDNCR